MKKKIKVQKTDAGRLRIVEYGDGTAGDQHRAGAARAAVADAGDIQELTQKVDRCIELVEARCSARAKQPTNMAIPGVCKSK